MLGLEPHPEPEDALLSFLPQAYTLDNHAVIAVADCGAPNIRKSGEKEEDGFFYTDNPDENPSMALLACGLDADDEDAETAETSSAGGGEGGDDAGWGSNQGTGPPRRSSGNTIITAGSTHYRGGQTQSQHQAAYQRYVDPTADSDVGMPMGNKGFGPFGGGNSSAIFSGRLSGSSRSHGRPSTGGSTRKPPPHSSRSRNGRELHSIAPVMPRTTMVNRRASSSSLRTPASQSDTPPMGWGHEKEDDADEEAMQVEELALAVEGGGGMRVDDRLLLSDSPHSYDESFNNTVTSPSGAGGRRSDSDSDISHENIGHRMMTSLHHGHHHQQRNSRSGAPNMMGMASFVELDEEEREVQERIRRTQRLTQEIMDEEQHQLKEIYTKQVRKSFRNVRRLPEPSIQGRFMQTEEDDEEQQEQEDEEELEDEEEAEVYHNHSNTYNKSKKRRSLKQHHHNYRTVLRHENSGNFFSSRSPHDNLDVPDSSCLCGQATGWQQSLVGHSQLCLDRQARMQLVHPPLDDGTDDQASTAGTGTPPPHYFIHESSSVGADGDVATPLSSSAGTPIQLGDHQEASVAPRSGTEDGGARRKLTGVRNSKRSFVNRIRLVAVTGGSAGTPPPYSDDEE